MDYDNSNIPNSYDAGREVSDYEKHKFLEFFTTNLSTENINKIIDLGCGTGRFSGVLSEIFSAKVIGVDPSQKMLDQANQKYRNSNIVFELAVAEELPLANELADIVFMSMVFHHLSHPQQVASECHRILRPNGAVCIRNTVADEISTYPYLDVFPSMGKIIKSQLISRQKLEKIFTSAGFELSAHQTQWHQISSSWQTFADKIALKADSFVARLDENEFELGLAQLRAKAQSNNSNEPVGLNVDAFIFNKI